MRVVAHLSDLHLGAHDPATVDSLVADVVGARPALTVITGDSTMRARTSQFREARRLLDRLPQPVLAVAGNHDLPLVSPLRLARPYARHRRWIAADLDPVVRVPGITALGLQSMPRWRWKNGRVTRRQAGEVVRVLGAAPAGDVRLLALHHPPPYAFGAARLIRAAGAARVDLLLAGHTHVPDVRGVTRPAGAGPVVVVAGTATSRRLRGTAPSWSLICTGPDSIVVRERYLGRSGWHTGRVVHCPRPGAGEAWS